MSYSTIHSSRGETTDRPDFSGNGGNVVKPINLIPRTGYGIGTSPVFGANIGVKAGFYLYPKPGETVFFYADSDAKQRVGASRNQTNAPKRSGSELVGRATGRTMSGAAGVAIELNWVNEYTNHNLIKADEKISEPRTGWVLASTVTWQAVYESPEEKENPTPDLIIPQNTGAASSGIDTTTLGFAAIGAALIFTRKKGKKK